MNLQTEPPPQPDSRSFKVGAVGLLALSALALLLAPSLMPTSYSWIRNSTSESAAQGVPGAWLARLGFLIFGLTVVWIASRMRGTWTTPVRVFHGAFGLLLAATAAFSTRSWLPGAPFDPVEDGLHSFTATAMGFAFAIGVVLRLLRRGRDRLGMAADLVVIVAAVTRPLGMNLLPEWDGLLQRGMFAVAYAWYAFEVLRTKDPG